jgi:hypothetical protein
VGFSLGIYMKYIQIVKHQEKLLIIFEYLKCVPDKVTTIHKLHADYLIYCKNKVSIKHAIGKFAFAGLIQSFGCRRRRSTGASSWVLPDEFDPDDLIELLISETERLIKVGENAAANFNQLK